MEILYLSGWYPSKVDPQNGVFVQKQAKAASRYCHVTVAHAQPSPASHSVEKKEKGNLMELIGYYSGGTPLHKARAYYKTIGSLLTFVNKPMHSFDLVHAHILTRSGYLAYKNFKKHGTPYVISEHWSGYATGVYEQLPKWKQKINRKIIDNAAAVVCVSDFLAGHMQKYLPHPNYKIIPNVVEATSMMARRNHTEFTFIVVADIVDKVKNISGIVRAFGEVVKHTPCRLHIVGDGVDKEKIRKLIYELGLEHRVTLYGKLTNEAVLPLYKQADALVINSNVETFSVVALEALAAGLPVVCTRCGGPEEILPEENTLFVEPNNTDQLQQAMAKVMTEKDQLAPFNTQAILTNYSSKAVGKQLFDLYNQILQA